MIIKFRASLLACSVAVVMALPAQAEDVFRYWDWGHSPRRENYEYALLQLVLKATTASHGPYKLERVRAEFSTNRVRREINIGTTINIRSGPYLPPIGDADPAAVNLPVAIPILYNLLGYRRLVIRKADLPAFKQIENLTELQSFSVGLARGWYDVQIYRHNQFAVDDSANVTNLISMLEMGRYDFFPSSIMEYDDFIAGAADPDELMVVPELVVLYPFPVVFYVAKTNHRFADRLRRGLEAVIDSGAMTRLFTEHFAQELAYLKENRMEFILLRNPLLANQDAVVSLPVHRPGETPSDTPQ